MEIKPRRPPYINIVGRVIIGWRRIHTVAEKKVKFGRTLVVSLFQALTISGPSDITPGIAPKSRFRSVELVVW